MAKFCDVLYINSTYTFYLPLLACEDLNPLVLTEYCKDLQTYLQFCKDIVFARSEPSRKDAKEEKLIETLWNYYQSGKVICSFLGVVIFSYLK